uniref:Uncharacterized protein n=1 Tax=Alexandrium monilatum TaxID=311494 RepID=A0A7S4RIB3_9DINO
MAQAIWPRPFGSTHFHLRVPLRRLGRRGPQAAEAHAMSGLMIHTKTVLAVDSLTSMEKVAPAKEDRFVADLVGADKRDFRLELREDEDKLGTSKAKKVRFAADSGGADELYLLPELLEDEDGQDEEAAELGESSVDSGASAGKGGGPEEEAEPGPGDFRFQEAAERRRSRRSVTGRPTSGAALAQPLDPVGSCLWQRRMPPAPAAPAGGEGRA